MSVFVFCDHNTRQHKCDNLTRETSTVDYASFEMVEFKFRTGQHAWQQESGFDRRVLALEVWILVSGCS